VRDCLHSSCFLTLYVYVLQRLPTSQSLDDELETLNLLVDWNSNARPRSVVIVAVKSTDQSIIQSINQSNF